MLEFFEQSMGSRNRVGTGLSYRPAKLHRLAESIRWNRFLGSSKVFYNRGMSGIPVVINLIRAAVLQLRPSAVDCIEMLSLADPVTRHISNRQFSLYLSYSSRI